MITQYLQGPFQEKGMEYKSPYMAALMDARAATGRDVTTGQIVDGNKVGNWAGALAYLVLIDHIGIYFSPRLGSNNSDKGFIKALKDFSQLPHQHIYALYALRCAFAHQYSLINKGQGKYAAYLHHQFEVHRGEVFITLPTVPWDGNRDPSTHHLITSISLKKLGDFVEDVHTTIVGHANNNDLISNGELIFIKYPVTI